MDYKSKMTTNQLTIGAVTIKQILQEINIKAWDEFPNITISFLSETEDYNLFLHISIEAIIWQNSTMTETGEMLSQALQTFFETSNISVSDVSYVIMEKLAEKYYDDHWRNLNVSQLFTCLGKWCCRILLTDEEQKNDPGILYSLGANTPYFSLALPHGLRMRPYDGDGDYPDLVGKMYHGTSSEPYLFLIKGREGSVNIPLEFDDRVRMLNGEFLAQEVFTSINKTFPFLKPGTVSRIKI